MWRAIARMAWYDNDRDGAVCMTRRSTPTAQAATLYFQSILPTRSVFPSSKKKSEKSLMQCCLITYRRASGRLALSPIQKRRPFARSLPNVLADEPDLQVQSFRIAHSALLVRRCLRTG